MIKRESILSLVENIDIVDVVSSYIDLKKSGASFKARCPFHEEKTPSFTVSPQKQFFHCFGCGVHGNVIKFVQDIETLPFVDAVQTLADRYGIKLEYENNREFQDKSLKKLSYLEVINSWFVENLYKNRDAYLYLKKRGLKDETIKKFQLGYAPSSYEVLFFLKSQKIEFRDAEEIGVVAFDENSKKYYSRFHERVIFPIFSPSGKIIAFGGRTLGNHPAKYINSPTTKFFNKSKTLYGYNFAKNSIFREKRVNIVEGYLDVIMLHQAGIENSVAPLGTALTKEHIYILKKGNPKINLAFDGDSAGVEATKRGLDAILPLGVESSVTLFDEGVDPADLIQNMDIQKVRDILDNPKDGVKFYIEQQLQNYDLNNPYSKAKAVNDAKMVISKLPSLLRDEYSKYLGSLLSVGAEQIKYRDRRIKTTEDINSQKEFFGLSEISILRSVLEDHSLLDILKSELEESDFINYKEAFRDIININWESDRLQKLLMTECNILNRDEFEIEIINHKIKRLTREKEILLKNNQLPFSEKLLQIKSIQYTLTALQKRKRVLEMSIIGG